MPKEKLSTFAVVSIRVAELQSSFTVGLELPYRRPSPAAPAVCERWAPCVTLLQDR
jgi:hypothetical protein